MDYLIRSFDGRLVVGLTSVDAARKVAQRLESRGKAVEILDLKVGDHHRAASCTSATRTRN